MNWPLAIVCIVAIAGTLIWLGCSSWYWTDQPPSRDEHQHHNTDCSLSRDCAHPTASRPSPAREPYW